LHVW